MNRILNTATQFIVVFLCCQATAISGVYKWEDSNGQIHYSDQPDHPGAEDFSIRKNTTTTPGAVADKNSDETEAENPGSEEPKTDEPKLVEIEPSNKEKKRQCNEAKSDIASISSRGRMREINKKGEYIYLTEEQRQQRLSAAKKKQREFCR